MTHPCPGCGTPVRPGLYACGGCWRRIPGDLRTAILRAWGRRLHGEPGPVAEHDTAKATADAWLEANPR